MQEISPVRRIVRFFLVQITAGIADVHPVSGKVIVQEPIIVYLYGVHRTESRLQIQLLAQ